MCSANSGRGWLLTRRMERMKVITTHLAADFDAFASAVCLRRLYPDHCVVFPGSLEAAVRRYLADTGTELPAVRLREARRHRWEDVVIVDTRSRSRLGEAWLLTQQSECPVTVIDHHVCEEGDDEVPASRLVFRPVGSTSTIVVELLQQHGLAPLPDEASLLAMGIYEDTGSLTYPETTAADLNAVGWLLECGAELDGVRRWVVRTLEPEQLDLLNIVVNGAEEIELSGVPVTFATADVDHYLEEAAAVVQRWVQVYDLPVAVALLSRPPHVTVILRSQHAELDVGAIAKRLGGGGHATAASARVRGRSVTEIREDVISAIQEQLPRPPCAGDIAVNKIFSVGSQTTVSATKERLNQLRVNALPVRSEEGRLVGTVTRQTLDMGLSHGLGERPVTRVMQPGVEIVDAMASLDEVRDLFLRSGRRFVLVAFGGGEPTGLITRMDFLRNVYSRQREAGESLDHRMEGARPTCQSVTHLMRRVAPDWVWELLEVAREVADAQQVAVYLVGGAVRDLLLERAGEDIDLVVEGDGIEFAEALARRIDARVHPHRPFLSAVLSLPEDHKVDVVSARTEFYRTPAALPEVETSLIRQDLFRRDFSINAMAVALSSDRFGQLLDFFGSRRDLRNRELRALHSLSFIDDPTRAIRAARYVRRLGFVVAQETRHLIEVAVEEGVFEMLSGERLRHELELLLMEPHPPKSLALLASFGVIGAVVRGLEWSDAVHSLLLEIERQVAWMEVELPGPSPDRLVLYVGGLTAEVGQLAASELANRLKLTGRRAATMVALQGDVARVRSAVNGERSLSVIVEEIERVSLEASLLAMARLGLANRRKVASALLASYRLELPVTGRDLLSRGVERGPAVGHGLREARRALLNGETRPEELVDIAEAAARSVSVGR